MKVFLRIAKHINLQFQPTREVMQVAVRRQRIRRSWLDWLRREWSFRFDSLYVDEDGVLYHRHANGGGWVAEGSDVDESAFVARTAMVGVNTTVGPRVELRSRTVVCNAQVWDDTIICSRSRIGSSSRVASQPQSRRTFVGCRCIIGSGSVVGMSAIVLDNVCLGYRSRVDPRAEIHFRSSYGPYFHAPSGLCVDATEVMLGSYYVLGEGYDESRRQPRIYVSFPMGIGW